MTINILYIIGSLERGGAEMHLLRLLPYLDKSHFHVKIFLLSKEGELADEFRKHNIKLITPWLRGGRKNLIAKLFSLSLTSLQLFLYLFFYRPRVTHFFLPESYLIAGPIAVLCALPIRIMSRRSLNLYQRKYPTFVRNLEIWLHTKMNAVLGNSQSVLDQLIHDEGVVKERAHLIYNGIEPPALMHTNLRNELALSKDSLVFTIVANLIPYKGHKDLLDAFAKARLKQPWDLLIVGKNSANIQQGLETQVQTLGLEKNIHFLGQRSDVSNLLHSSDIGLLTSHEEGFSNVILEGMSAGIPMIVTDVGGNSEAVLHEETGLVVPAHDPEQLANAIQRLAYDSALRQCLGEKGTSRQKNEFSLKACVTSYEKLYKNLNHESLQK